jgi:hypothetical protein
LLGAQRKAKAAAPKRGARRRAETIFSNALQATARQAIENRMKFLYVYILQSENSAEHFYIGFTEDLQDRLKIHNTGSVPHTVKFRP